MNKKIIRYIAVLIAAILIITGTAIVTDFLKPKRNDTFTTDTSDSTNSEPAISESDIDTLPTNSYETDDDINDTTVIASPESETSSSELEISEPESETTMESSIPLRDPDHIIDITTTLYTYDMMEADLHYLVTVYPEHLSLHSAGTTTDGRELYYVILGNPSAERQIYVCASTHAREYMTTQLVMSQLAFYCAYYDMESYNGVPFSEIFDKTCFYIEPMVNPDGVTISQFGEEGLHREDLRENLRAIFASDLNSGLAETDDYARYLVRWKANALGVDINRNYSPGWETVTDRSAPSSTFFKGNAPGDQAESQAQMSIINSLSNPLMTISYHSYGDFIYWQYGQAEPLWTENQNLAQNISNMTGQYLAGYSNEAGFSNWCIIEKGIKSVTVEAGTVPAPLPLDQFAELWAEHKYVLPMLGVIY